MNNYNSYTIRKAWFLLLFCGFTLYGFSQINTVKGQIIDDANNPVSLVHVMLFLNDDFVVGAVTDSEGNFVIDNLKDGSYRLKIQGIGYQEFVQELMLNDNELDLGTVMLTTSSIELEAVELVAEKRQYEKYANSLVIDVEQNIAGSGGSVLDILGTTAGISVNQQNGTLTLNNQGKVAIMIDGKLTRIDGQALIGLLESMPSSNIKNFEIFNNPPSKYEANGSAGMVNIVTKTKNNKNQGGAVSLTSGYGRGEKTGGALSYNFQGDKTSWYGSYAFNRNRTFGEWGLESEFNNPLSQKSVVVTSHREPVINAHNYSLGMESYLFKNTAIGINLSGYNSHWNMTAFDNVVRNAEAINSETLDIETTEENQWNHIGGDVFLEQSLGEHQKLTLGYSHLYYNYDNPSSYDTRGRTDFAEVLKETPIAFNVFNLDYRWNLSESIKIEIGAKATSSDFTNTITVSSDGGSAIIIDEELSSRTQMKEQINALYASGSLQVNENTSLHAGIRYEHTNNKLDTESTGEPVQRVYGNFFSNVTVGYQINEEHRFQLNYGGRINRPTFDNLAPYVLFLGPEALYSGNASLQPSLAHKIGAEWKWLKRYVSIDYLVEESPIIEFQPRLSTNGEQYIFKAENMDNRDMLTISAGIPFQIKSWWKMENNMIFQYESIQFRFQEIDFDRSKASMRLTSSQQFSLGTKTKLELSGYYQSATLYGISTYKDRGSANIGLQQQLKGNHGKLKLSFRNIFSTDNWRTETNNNEPFINTLETYFPESRILTLTYSKNFGGSKKEQKFRNNTAEEKQRVQ